MQLKMQRALTRLNWRSYYARSLLAVMRIMTQCWVLYVKHLQSLSFLIISCTIKYQRPLKSVTCLRKLTPREICCQVDFIFFGYMPIFISNNFLGVGQSVKVRSLFTLLIYGSAHPLRLIRNFVFYFLRTATMELVSGCLCHP